MQSYQWLHCRPTVVTIVFAVTLWNRHTAAFPILLNPAFNSLFEFGGNAVF